MLSVRNLQVAYGSVQALWDISFDVPEGEIVAIIGANGAGKSTTLKTLAGLLKPMGGTISLDGETARPGQFDGHRAPSHRAGP